MGEAIGTDRVPWRISLVLGVGGAITFLGGAIVLIPWGDLPSGAVAANTVFDPAQLHALRSYASSQRHLSWTAYFLNVAFALALACVPMIRRWFTRLPGRLWAQLMVGAALVSVASAALRLPFAWGIFQNARDAGVSVSSTGLWWRDYAVTTVINAIPLVLIVLVVAGVVRWLPRVWPLALAAIAGCAVVVMSLVFPVVIAPLFATTHPLPPGPLRTAIFDLAAHEGVRLGDVVVADASTRTTAENAQVLGFGPTERVVLDDTLLRSMDDREIQVIVGHELGHAAHHDVLIGTLLGAAGAIAGIGFAGLIVIWRRRTGSLMQAGAIPVAFAVMTVGAFVISPLENSMSRAMEARADRVALAATHDPDAFVRAQKQLNLAARLDPTPPSWSQFWWGSHPTVLERIGLTRDEVSR